MGGLFDASNVSRREDKVCIITDIGFDHMNVLGNTISKIAMQKARNNAT
jgi:dihydrofolate synthase / folylpolyglutamate synthase